MKDNDNIILENLYMKSKGILLKEQNNDIFSNDVLLSINLEENFDAPRDVHVKYRIEVEYREYGIKEINTYFVSCSPFVVEVSSINEDGDQKVDEYDIDISSLENVETSLSVGDYGGVFPKELSVTLRMESDDNGNTTLSPVFANLEF